MSLGRKPVNPYYQMQRWLFCSPVDFSG